MGWCGSLCALAAHFLAAKGAGGQPGIRRSGPSLKDRYLIAAKGEFRLRALSPQVLKSWETVV